MALGLLYAFSSSVEYLLLGLLSVRLPSLDVLGASTTFLLLCFLLCRPEAF